MNEEEIPQLAHAREQSEKIAEWVRKDLVGGLMDGHGMTLEDLFIGQSAGINNTLHKAVLTALTMPDADRAEVLAEALEEVVSGLLTSVTAALVVVGDGREDLFGFDSYEEHPDLRGLMLGAFAEVMPLVNVLFRICNITGNGTATRPPEPPMHTPN